MFLVSATTREPREGEVDGKSYHFVKLKNFKELVEEGMFVEHNEVYPGVLYGTLFSEFEDKTGRVEDFELKPGQIGCDGFYKFPVLDLDVDGAQKLKQIMGESLLLVGVLPESIEQLEQQLKKRATDSKDKIQIRLERAEKEIKKSQEIADFCVVNRPGQDMLALGEISRKAMPFIRQKLHIHLS